MCPVVPVTTSVGTICISSGDIWGTIGGAVLFIIGMWVSLPCVTPRYNILIFVFHPAFKKGQRKITDDPTASYTAGESVVVLPRSHSLGNWQCAEEQSWPRSEDVGWCFEAVAVQLFVRNRFEKTE